jgi:hypothetical protein
VQDLSFRIYDSIFGSQGLEKREGNADIRLLRRPSGGRAKSKRRWAQGSGLRAHGSGLGIQSAGLGI